MVRDTALNAKLKDFSFIRDRVVRWYFFKSVGISGGSRDEGFIIRVARTCRTKIFGVNVVFV